MSQTIDNKVVELQFNNQDFEKNVSTSISTLDKLKAALKLDGVTSGLDNIRASSEKINFSGLSNALGTVSAKFSALDTIAFTALQNITNKAVDAGEKIVKSLSIDNVAAGWEKFGEKSMAVGTLSAQGYDMDTINDQLEKLNWYTDETSYNFTDMVNNIAKFTASGQDLETSVSAMEGIANWAALSGQNAQKASQAMYQLSQAMGAGVMRKEDYKSIQNVSMDTQEFRQKALDAAVALGTLKKTGEDTYSSLVGNADEFTKSQFTEKLTEGAWFTSDVMMKVFNEYGSAIDQIYEYSEEHGITASEAIEELGGSVDEFGLKAFKAAQEARTFGDVLDSVKDAVSTAWMNVFETIFGGYDESKKLWTSMANELYEVFATPVNNLQELLEGAFTKRNFIDMSDLIGAGFEEGSDKLAAFQKLLIATAKEHDIDVESMIEEEGSFADSLEKGWLTADIFNEALGKIGRGDVKEGLSDTKQSLDEIHKLAREVIRGDYGDDWATRYKKLGELGFTTEQIDRVREYVNLLHKVTGGTWDLSEAIYDQADAMIGNVETLAEMSDEQLLAQGYTEDEIAALRELAKAAEDANTPLGEFINNIERPSGRELLSETIITMIKKIQQATEFLGKVWHSVFPPTTSEQIYNIVKGIHDFVQNLGFSGKNLNMFRQTLAGVLSLLHMFIDGIKAVAKNVFPTVGEGASNFIEGVLRVTSAIGRYLLYLDRSTKKAGVFDKIFKPVGERLATVFSTISKYGGKLVEFIEKFFNDLRVKGFTMPEGFTDVFDRIKETFSGLIDYLKGGKESVSKIFDGLKSAFSGFVNFVSDGKVFASDFSTIIGTVFSKIAEIARPVLSFFKEFASLLGGNLTDALAAFLKSLGNANFERFINLLTGLATVGVGSSLIKMITQLKDSIKGFSSVIFTLSDIKESFVGVLDSVSESLNSFAKSQKIKDLRNIAVSILILVGALYILSTIDGADLAKAIAGITALFAELVLAYVLIDKFTSKEKNKSKFGTSMIMMAASLLILASAVKKLSSLSWEEMAKGLVGVLGLLGEIVLFTKLMGDSKVSLKTGIAMIAIAGALNLMVPACKELASLKWEEIGKALAGIGGLLGELAIFSLLAGKSKHIMSTALSMVIISAALKILVSVVKDISDLDYDDVKKGLLTIGGLLAEVAAFTVLSSVSKRMLSTSASLVIIGAALKLIIGVIKDISTIDYESIQKGLLTIGALLLEISAFSIASSFGSNMLVLGAGLVILSGGIALLVPSLKSLGEMDLASIGKALLALAGSFVIIATTGVVMGLLGPVLIMAAGALIMFAAAIALLVPSLKALGKMKMANLGKALLSLASVFALFVAAGLAIGALSPILTGAAIALAAFGVAAIAIGGGLMLIGSGLTSIGVGIRILAEGLGDGGKVIIEAVVETAKALIDLIPYLINKLSEAIGAICDAIIENAPKIGEALKTMLITALDVIKTADAEIADTLLSIILTVLEKLKEYGPRILDAIGAIIGDLVARIDKYVPDIVRSMAEKIKSIGEGIVDALKNMTAKDFTEVLAGVGVIGAIVAGLAILPALLPSLLAGVGSLALLIASLGTAFVAIGALAQIPGVEWLLDEGAEFAKKVGSAIGEFFGSIISGFVDEATSTLPTVGEHLASFMENAQPFFDGLANISNDTLDAIGTLSTALLKLTAAELLDGIAGFITGKSDIDSFVDTLPKLGSSLTEFADSLGDSLLNEDKITASTNLASILATLAAEEIPKTGGVVQWLMGESDLTNFAKQIPMLGAGLSLYAEQIDAATFTEDKITASTNLASTLAALANEEIPKIGGIVQWIMGESDLTNFAKQLPILGAGLSEYANAIDAATFTEDKITASTNLASTLAALTKDTIPKTGGIVQWVMGESDLSGFGNDLKDLASGLKTYLDEIDAATFTEDKITASTNLASTLAALANQEIPETGGVLQWLIGEKSLGSFGDNIKKFGEGMAGYYESISGSEINLGNILISNAVASSLAQLATDLETVKTGGWLKQGSLTGFGGELKSFGEQLSGYYEFIRKINVGKLNEIDNFLMSFMEIAKTVSTGELADFKAEDMNQFGQALENLSGIKLTGFIDSIEKKTLEVKTAAEGFVGGFLGAFKNIDTKSISEAADNLIKAFSDSFGTTESIGDAAKNLIQAIADGLSTNSGAVTSASTSLVTAITQSISSHYDSFKAAGTLILGNIVSGFRTASYTANSAARSLALAIYNTISAYRTSMRGVGTSLASNFVNGLYSMTSSAYNAGDSLSSSAISGASGHSMWSIGYNLGTSLAHGLRDALPSVTAAANDIVEQANRVVTAKEEIKSPSKVWTRYGRYMGQGLANGLLNMRDSVGRASESVVNNANDAITDTVSKINDMINAGMDAQPVIRPVVDLSDVQAGMQAANSMFDFAPSMGVLTNLNAISMSMNRRNQNAVSNEDVVNAVNSLKDVLGENRNNYYVNGVTYADTNKDIISAIQTLIQFTTMEGRA